MSLQAEVQAQQLAGAACCAAVSASGLVLALCPNSTEVLVYERAAPDGQWKEAARLADHEATVSGLDLHGDDRLVSSSHDRNSYVWTRGADGSWAPELVITRLTHAGLCVRWSPCGRKFAIGSSAKCVCVCHYDVGRELWAPRLIRKQHGSSVTAVAWHPTASLLATVSTDSKLRLFNAAVPGKRPVSQEAGARVRAARGRAACP
jgi:actin related protein 2/3 complex subunit 1A/1B